MEQKDCRHEFDPNIDLDDERILLDRCRKCGLQFKDYHIPRDMSYTCHKCGKTFTSGHTCEYKDTRSLAEIWANKPPRYEKS